MTSACTAILAISESPETNDGVSIVFVRLVDFEFGVHPESIESFLSTSVSVSFRFTVVIGIL